MYLDYWQLERKPFEPNIAEGFFYPSESHRGAILKLRYAIENGRAAAVVAGPSGVGKTLLVETLIDSLPETQSANKVSPVVQVVYPQMSSRELLAYLAERLAPSEEPSYTTPSVDQSWLRIENALSTAAERGEQPLVVVEEAHMLED
ncbi:MAG: ExeA family protein, partial [Aeoliella sp.]